jgi:hypothetical protein
LRAFTGPSSSAYVPKFAGFTAGIRQLLVPSGIHTRNGRIVLVPMTLAPHFQMWTGPKSTVHTIFARGSSHRARCHGNAEAFVSRRGCCGEPNEPEKSGESPYSSQVGLAIGGMSPSCTITPASNQRTTAASTSWRCAAHVTDRNTPRTDMAATVGNLAPRH